MFIRPKKYIVSSGSEPPELGYVDIRTLADSVCRYDLNDMDAAWLELTNEEFKEMGERRGLCCLAVDDERRVREACGSGARLRQLHLGLSLVSGSRAFCWRCACPAAAGVLRGTQSVCISRTERWDRGGVSSMGRKAGAPSSALHPATLPVTSRELRPREMQRFPEIAQGSGPQFPAPVFRFFPLRQCYSDAAFFSRGLQFLTGDATPAKAHHFPNTSLVFSPQ